MCLHYCSEDLFIKITFSLNDKLKTPCKVPAWSLSAVFMCCVHKLHKGCLSQVYSIARRLANLCFHFTQPVVYYAFYVELESCMFKD